MMRRIGLWVLALELAACGPEKPRCTRDEQCAADSYCVLDLGRCGYRSCTGDAQCGPGLRCDLGQQRCVEVVDSGEADAGDGGVDGGADAGVCAPACAAFEECGGGVCVARYAAVGWLSPTSGTKLGAGAIALAAELRLVPGRTRNDPSELELVFTDGGAAGSLGRADAGYYQGSLVPAREGRLELAARYGAAGLASTTLELTVDRTAPVFSVQVNSPTRPPADGGQLATMDPEPGYAQAWRRDEKATVIVSSSATDVNVASVKLWAVGIEDGGAPGLSVSLMPRTGCGQPYCATAELELSLPRMDAFRGELGLRVLGQDDLGNEGGVDGGVKVTRWKWAYDTGAKLSATPAISSGGTLYVGTQDNFLEGRLHAIDSSGRLLWSFDAGAIEASPSVGVEAGGMELVFVASESASGAALRAHRSDGGVVHECLYASGRAKASFSVAALERFGETVVSGATVVNLNPGGRLVALRPEAVLSADRCVDQGNAGLVDYLGGVATNGVDFFFAQGSGSTDIKGFSFSNGNWAAKQGWPSNVWLFTRAPALVGTNVVGGGGGLSEGVAVSLSMDGGTEWRYSVPGSSPVPNFASPVIGLGSVLVAGTADSRLRQVAIGAGAGVATPTDGPILGAVALGEGGYVYGVTQAGTVGAWKDDLGLRWDLAGLGMDVQASPTLDCARDSTGARVAGRPGVLYVASSNGKLYAFIVDSRGIDVSAPWPKYQHDPRNTGNSTTSLSEFSCP